MKFSDLKDLTLSELKVKKAKAALELFELKMKNSLGQVQNRTEIKNLRRDIARISTALTTKSAK